MYDVIKYINGLLSKYETLDGFVNNMLFQSTRRFEHNLTAVQMYVEMKKKYCTEKTLKTQSY